MLLREHARRIVHGLQVRHGWCFATERAKGRMVAEKRGGLLPGARSMYRVEKQLERLGQLERKLIWPGDRMPNGDVATKHLAFVRLITRQERRAKERKKAKLFAQRQRRAEREQREKAAPPRPPRVAVDETPASAGVAGETAAGAQAVLAALARKVILPSAGDAERFELERQRQLDAAAALAATWKDDKPPDE
jgi:hypothetical protein